MDNYICINGKKAELTEKQMKALGIELSKATPFDRVEERKAYYVIGTTDKVDWFYESGDKFDEECFNIGNYCTDKAILEQRALHETLNRLLWRYSMEHDGDKIDWSNVSDKWAIYYEYDTGRYKTAAWQTIHYLGHVFFNTREIAEKAITEIVKPFMKAHPEFKW